MGRIGKSQHSSSFSHSHACLETKCNEIKEAGFSFSKCTVVVTPHKVEKCCRSQIYLEVRNRLSLSRYISITSPSISSSVYTRHKMCILPRRRSRRKEGPTVCIGHAYTSMERIYFLTKRQDPFIVP